MLDKFSDELYLDVTTINYMAADIEKTAYLIGLYDGREFITEYEVGKRISERLDMLRDKRHEALQAA